MLPARSAFIALGLALAAPTVALADTYTLKTFTGGIFGGNANVSAPFGDAGIVQGMSFSGAFLQDDTLVPAAGSGFFNVFTDNYPDVALIPPATLFTLNIGSLTLTAADDTQPFTGAGVQYNNGHFNGFAYNGDFTFENTPYEMIISGGTFSVLQVIDGFPQGHSFVNGFINIGDAAVAGGTPFTPAQPGGGAPEPASWALMILGFGAVGGLLRRRHAKALA